MPAILCIVGKPKAGKTTLIEKLIPVLKSRGYRVATIKHTTHDFKTDVEGKDSYKHARAGSECTVISSANKVALVREVDHDLSPAELSRIISADFDIVLAEGFKRFDAPKVEVVQKGGQPVCPPNELIAIVADELMDLNLPRYLPDNIEGLATLIEERILKPRQKIVIFADGQPVSLKPFVYSLYHKLILDMTLSLKGLGKVKRIDISVRR